MRVSGYECTRLMGKDPRLYLVEPQELVKGRRRRRVRGGERDIGGARCEVKARAAPLKPPFNLILSLSSALAMALTLVLPHLHLPD